MRFLIKSFTGILVCVLSLAIGRSAVAHHNWQAIFDLDKDAEITGMIASIHWKNPHVMLDVAVSQPSGAPKIWTIDSGSVAVIKRMGLEPDMLLVGETVKIAGYPSRRDPAGLYMTNLFLPDGREMIFRRGVAPRYSEVALGTDDPYGTIVIEPDINKRPSSIFSIWTTVWGNPDSHHLMSFKTQDFNITAQAREIAHSIDLEKDHPLYKCDGKGMPFAMA